MMVLIFAEDIIQNIGSIGPEAEFTYSFTVTGLKLGSHDLVVGMESDKVELVTGQKEVCSNHCILCSRPTVH